MPFLPTLIQNRVHLPDSWAQELESFLVYTEYSLHSWVVGCLVVIGELFQAQCLVDHVMPGIEPRDSACNLFKSITAFRVTFDVISEFNLIAIITLCFCTYSISCKETHHTQKQWRGHHHAIGSLALVPFHMQTFCLTNIKPWSLLSCLSTLYSFFLWGFMSYWGSTGLHDQQHKVSWVFTLSLIFLPFTQKLHSKYRICLFGSIKEGGSPIPLKC